MKKIWQSNPPKIVKTNGKGGSKTNAPEDVARSLKSNLPAWAKSKPTTKTK
jgi:hypothetical protein